MSHQIAKNLYLGDDQVSREGFHLALDLTEWHAEEAFEYKDYSVPYRAIQEIHKHLYKLGSINELVLVFCHGGMDRSPFVVAMYLHHYHGKTVYEAYEAVKKRHPQTIIHDDWAISFSKWLSSRNKYSKRNP